MSATLPAATEERISQRFPGRVCLSPGKVAEAWRGVLVPGLQKNGGGWEVPVGKLIEAIEEPGDDEDKAAEKAADPVGVTEALEFWGEVFDELDRLETERVRVELGATVMEWKWISAEEHEKWRVRSLVIRRKKRTRMTKLRNLPVVVFARYRTGARPGPGQSTPRSRPPRRSQRGARWK
ncbi:TPA: hypothetical protein ACGCGR_002198 [Stenotrophomonas maltophilia]